jgi:hypothetical protein
MQVGRFAKQLPILNSPNILKYRRPASRDISLKLRKIGTKVANDYAKETPDSIRHRNVTHWNITTGAHSIKIYIVTPSGMV